MSKALVLSGGGPVGIAWETGIAAGLAAEGVDLRTADFILGTSAGASVGAQIALGRDLGPLVERYRARVQEPPSEGADAAAPASATAMRIDLISRLPQPVDVPIPLGPPNTQLSCEGRANLPSRTSSAPTGC